MLWINRLSLRRPPSPLKAETTDPTRQKSAPEKARVGQGRTTGRVTYHRTVGHENAMLSISALIMIGNRSRAARTAIRTATRQDSMAVSTEAAPLAASRRSTSRRYCCSKSIIGADGRPVPATAVYSRCIRLLV